MIISVASGKGGTGKTTVSTNIAKVLEKDVILIDCDVEEPDSHIFLKPEIDEMKKVTVPVPEIDLNKCTFCVKCAEICMFKALLVLKDNVIVFPELCHNCGGCKLVCPEEAVKEIPREIGIIEKGRSGEIDFVHGILRVGDVLVPHLIRELKTHAGYSKTVIIDSPPGTSCPVIEAVKGSDICILVTEPTPFGLHDLKLAVEMLRKLKIPFYVILNRADTGYEEVSRYCESENIKILMKIPVSREIAELYSKGEMVVDKIDGYKKEFQNLIDTVMK